VAADYEYFVASPAQLTALDLAKSPLSQLSAERAAELPGIDPAVVLPGLVEVLSTRPYGELLANADTELAYDGGAGGPWVTVIDAFVVDAIRGADGDPELEWEDAVDQWSRLVSGELEDAIGDGDVDAEALLEITDELRRLCGATDATHRLYCWSQL
jgi:hypothetical protein